MVKLTVQLESGAALLVDVNPTSRIWEVIQSIAKETGNDGMLLHNKKPLQCNISVAHAGLCAGSCLQWSKWIRVRIASGKVEWKQIDVWRCADVSTIKCLIQKKLNIPTDIQVLSYKGQELKDTDILEECGVIETNSKLHLSIQDKSTQSFRALKQFVKTLSTVEQQQATQDARNRETQQELSEKCHKLEKQQQELKQDLTSMNEKLSERLQTVELENKKLRKEVDALKNQRSTETAHGHRTTGHMRDKLMSNWTAFRDLNLDIADYLFEAKVLSRDKYKRITDTHRNSSTADRVMEILIEVLESEGNVRELHKVLKKQDDNRSQELASLLE